MWFSIEKALLPATAYFMLALSATWAFIFHFITYRVLSPGFFSFVLYFFTGIFGIWHYVNLHNGSQTKVTTCFKASKFITNLYCLPIILSDLYFHYNFSGELIIAHLILPLLALVFYGTNVPADKTLLTFKKYSPQHSMKETIDFVMFCSVVSLVIVSILGNNICGVLAAFVYALTHFMITEEGYVEWMDMPAEPIYVSGMGMFCLLGMRAMMACYN